MAAAPVSYIWDFQVRPGCEAVFLEHYGADGSWARLFRRAEGFIETALLQDRTAERRYLTIDRWQSAEAYEAFRRQFAAQYGELDRQCETLTVSERCIGAFDE